MHESSISPEIYENGQKNTLNSPKREIEEIRIILFELMKLCIKKEGAIDSKMQFLHYFAEIKNIDEEYFNDLFMQATTLQKEISKSINLILE